MKNFLFVLLSIGLTVLCWGVYGPVLHVGQHAMDNSKWRPFMCVGLAYFAIAVAAPLAVLLTKGEKGSWTASGTLWSLAAGAAGALGALGIILAFAFQGKPVYVMPLVFGSAPVVNTFLTMAMSRTFKQAGPLFLAGVVLVASGAAMLMYFKPSAPKAVPAAQEGQPAAAAPTNSLTTSAGNFLMVGLAIGLTGLSWGVYGPVLHKGQMKMNGSRLRPLMCVGLAYFAIAVVVPFLKLSATGEPGDWTFSGFMWSLAGGAAGAVGALGIIMAFNFGGKPVYVMPVVFGGAPVVNTFTSITADGLWAQTPSLFFAALLVVILGAVMVLVFAPKGHAPAPAPSPAGT